MHPYVFLISRSCHCRTADGDSRTFTSSGHLYLPALINPHYSTRTREVLVTRPVFTGTTVPRYRHYSNGNKRDHRVLHPDCPAACNAATRPPPSAPAKKKLQLTLPGEDSVFPTEDGAPMQLPLRHFSFSSSPSGAAGLPTLPGFEGLPDRPEVCPPEYEIEGPYYFFRGSAG